MGLMLSELVEPHPGHAVRPSCRSRSKTSAMNAGRHRMRLYLHWGKVNAESAWHRRQALRGTAQNVARDARRYPPAQRVHITERSWLPEAGPRCLTRRLTCSYVVSD